MDFTIRTPIEILVCIFKFLSASDRAAASKTCKRWYGAANYTCFLQKKSVIVTGDTIEPVTSILKIFEESDLPYSSYLFENVKISNELNKFWDNVGENIRELTFQRCEIPQTADLHVLNKFKNLEVLKIEFRGYCFESGLPMDAGSENALSLNNLKTLSLTHFHGSCALLLRYFKAAPNIQDLDLSRYSISFNDSGTFLTSSKSTVLFKFLLAFIVERAQNMKRISFSFIQIDDAALKCLSEVKNLSLDILEVQHCSDAFTDAGIKALSFTDAGIKTLTSFQKNLRVLDIAGCNRVTDLSLISICHNLTNLEELNVAWCRITDVGVVELTQLKKLRVLNMLWCNSVTSVGITNGICSNVNRTMNDLYIPELDLDELCIINMSEKLPELRKLNVSECSIAVTDTSIQAILKNQIWLRSLKLSSCRSITDEGLTGMSKCDLVKQDEANKLFNSQNDYSPPKINLGSKSENEIVGDVKLMHENIPDDIISLARLKGLIDLDLKNCIRVSDDSLKYAFKLKELVSLDLSCSKRITHKGMEFLVNNCPGIETLTLSYCDQMNDEGVDIIAKGLRRLKVLSLQGCKQLTNKSLVSIRSHCECLQHLDVRCCSNMSKDLALSLKAHIKTLRTVDKS